MSKNIKRILVTGAVGQIGSELTLALRKRYGAENVVATGRKTAPSKELAESGPFYYIDVTKRASLDVVIRRHEIDTVFHMAAILSAVGEKNPQLCWDVNMNGTINVLEAARDYEMARVIIPSSIAAFGPETPRDNTPQETVLKPRTMYGVTKVAGELLTDYYVRRFGVDARGLRYPGIISAETLPGGGTTDYAVEIYYKAVEQGSYKCFVRADTALPMMYMPDCIKATMDLAEADQSKLRHYSDFNVGAMSFTAGELAANIAGHVPGFTCTYEPDFRQKIADSWPTSLDDSAARQEWGWAPAWDLDAMTVDMLAKLRARHEKGELYKGAAAE
ncbi:MAG TPA: NAD-dependent epimerase/dehydratase family protein [Candidatus Fermentibacter daniensis]|nr:NAD-dependent epimerase/dehydratase family protein [Candidatus Fermentibacter daniensis]HOR06579.1 NAD-dependent epimerase/dehydratase family protein [Candidatus Fermentibacter daniensis]HPK50808.1 NAD-dependent epimerase/dehydratase family protein [Candidatus Fermentibacter daniensis]